MNTEVVWEIVQEIDHQLSLIERKNIAPFKPLIELRNRILLKYKPDPSIDWTIKNKKLSDFLHQSDWIIHWKN